MAMANERVLAGPFGVNEKELFLSGDPFGAHADGAHSIDEKEIVLAENPWGSMQTALVVSLSWSPGVQRELWRPLICSTACIGHGPICHTLRLTLRLFVLLTVFLTLRS